MGLEHELMTSNEAAEIWGVTPRRVQFLCGKGQVKGAVRMGRTWIIPKGATKPIDGRTKAAKQKNNPIIHTAAPDAGRIIGMVNGTMAIENMPLTDEDRERLMAVLKGEVTADEMVRRLVVKHRRGADAGSIRI
jgi:hypothetical protein